MNGKWYWIELIGFDNASPDFGTERFLSRLSETPEGIALLFSDVDFIHSHPSGAGEYVLPPAACSYNGHRYSQERERQDWTNVQVRGLVAALQARGIKVIFGCFDFAATGGGDGNVRVGEFVRLHPEARAVGSRGERLYLVDVLSRLSDGTLYEDFLAAQLDRVIEDYGFDGVQLADGLSSARLSLQNGGCSDSLFGQFLEATGIRPPADVLAETGEDAEAFARRREWIFTEKLCDWIGFLSDRWAAYYRKVVGRVWKNGRLIVFNTAWTRSPFEALYRYGIDYGKIALPGIYAAMVEETSATLPILSSEDNGGFYLPMSARRYYHYEFALMQMKIRAYLPRLRQLSLSPVNDTVEQWDILKHAPMEMTRAILRRRNSVVFDGERYVTASDAPFYCLADGVSKPDWEYIESVEALACPPVSSVNGFSLVWPDGSALYRELERYIATRDYTADALSNELFKNGFPIASAVRACDADKVRTPLLALNPASWTRSERRRLLGSGNPVLAVSTRRLPEFRAKADWCAEGRYLSVYLIGRTGDESLARTLQARGAKKKCGAGVWDDHGAIWTSPLRYNAVDAGWFRALSEWVADAFGIPRNVNGEVECKVTALSTSGCTERLLISNDEYYYALPEIRLHRKMKSVRSLVKFRGYECPVTQSGFIIRVPPRGMELVEVEYEEK